MESLIYRTNKGAIEADKHYSETGHKIELFGQQFTFNKEVERHKRYKCTKCDFESFSGEIKEKWIS